MKNIYKKLLFSIAVILMSIGFTQSAFASTVSLDLDKIPAPTPTSVSFSVNYNADGDFIDSISIRYGTDILMSSQTSLQAPVLKSGTLNFLIDNLTPGTKYYFQAVALTTILKNGVLTSGHAESIIFPYTTDSIPFICAINNFTPNVYNVTSGSPAYISWNTTNCTNVTLTPSGYSALNYTNYPVYPAYPSTTYTLNASNGINSDSKSFTITVNNYNPVYCTIDSFRSNNYNITEGDPAYISWSTSNCSYATLSPIGYSATYSPGYTVYPSYPSTTYRLIGSNGVTNSLTIYVSRNNGGGGGGCMGMGCGTVNKNKPIVTTNSVSDVTVNSAILHGFANGSGNTINVWFEYGTTPSMNSSTSTNYGGYVTNANGSLGGLLANTTYYFRMAASNSYGTSYGNIMSFVTGPKTIVYKNNNTGTVVKGTTNTVNTNTDSINSNNNKTVDLYNNQNSNNSGLTASAGSAGFSLIPHTFLGWLLLVLVILVVIIIVQRMKENKYTDRGI